jgi:hypothetical protein
LPATRVTRDFRARPQEDQKWLQENTWCDTCDLADLGIPDPHEYAEGGALYVEGNCLRCGTTIRSTIEVVESNSQGLPPNTSLERTREG